MMVSNRLLFQGSILRCHVSCELLVLGVWYPSTPSTPFLFRFVRHMKIREKRKITAQGSAKKGTIKVDGNLGANFLFKMQGMDEG